MANHQEGKVFYPHGSVTSPAAFRKLRDAVNEYTTSLRPFGGKIYLKVDFALMFLNRSE